MSVVTRGVDSTAPWATLRLPLCCTAAETTLPVLTLTLARPLATGDEATTRLRAELCVTGTEEGLDATLHRARHTLRRGRGHDEGVLSRAELALSAALVTPGHTMQVGGYE